MTVAAQDVKALRDRTGLPMMKCKKALVEAGGDIDKAIETLRKAGLNTSGKEGRSTGEGRVGSYVHHNGKIGVLLIVNCETDFVANSDDFKQLVSELGMHICAYDPVAVSRESVPADVVEKEREIYKAQVADKPVDLQDKIVDGKIEAFFKERCLVDQKFVCDEKITVKERISLAVQKLGENISIDRFQRFQLG